jgi:gliding motility-associated-like protein
MNVSKLSIFNRYGQEVYSKNNYTNEWHGQTKQDNELPTGTYYYVIESENNQQTGWVYLNRKD